MRLKDPFSLKAAEMTKRTNKPRKPRDEESSDEVSGKLTWTPRRGINLVELLKTYTFSKENAVFIKFLKINLDKVEVADQIIISNKILWTGLTCQHVGKAVDLTSVKKSVLSSVWLVCSDCLKERTMIDADTGASHDIVVCLKCGFQVNIMIFISHTRVPENTVYLLCISYITFRLKIS